MKFSSRTKRIALFGTVSSLTVAMIVLILALLNYLSFRHFIRNDLTTSGVYSLSATSIDLLHYLEKDVNIYVFYPKSSELFPYISFLVSEMEQHSKYIHVHFIDIDKELLKVQEYKQKFKLSNEQYIVVEQDELFRVLVRDDIAQYNYQDAYYGAEPELEQFTGEQAILSAIVSVTSNERITVYFSRGHGEKSIDDARDDSGYAEALNRLRYNNYSVRTILPAKEEKMPDDADLLIIAGPQQRFNDHEVSLVNTYLADGKSLLLLIDPGVETGLQSIVERYGIEIGNDIVLDPEQHIPFSSPAYLLASIIPVKSLTGNFDGMTGVFFLSRSVTVIQDDTMAEHYVLAQTTPAGWAETNFDQNPPQKDSEIDHIGPVSIAVAAESISAPSSRIAVFGDSDFASNSQIMNMANADFFMSTVKWLINKSGAVAISPKKFRHYTIEITGTELSRLTFIMMILVPGVVIATGIAVWNIRKK